MKKIVLLLILIQALSVSRAQYLKEFTLDTTTYIQELSTFFGTTLKEEEEQIFDGFVSTWDALDDDTRSDIMQISELMRQRSCRPKPQFFTFISILEEFHRENKLDLGYDEWIEGYMKFMENKSTLIVDINKVNQTSFLLLDQSKLYSSVSLEWKFSSLNYRFQFDDELKIVTDDNDLVGISGNDSIVISNVSGYVSLVQQQFHGSSGKVFWDRAGLNNNSVYADLSSFQVDLKKSQYKADSVVFFHKELLDSPAPGELIDKISQYKSPELAMFPHFTTYQSSYILNDIFDGINYRGAIAMQGANLAGTASNGVNATIEIYYNDTVRVAVNSNLFLFGSKLLRSNNAEVTIYIDSDSIYHPDLVLSYDKEKELLRLTRSKDYNSQGPYSNSYHRIDMSFDELNWVRSESVMRMQAALGTALGNGLFESYDFFNLEFYESLQAMEYQHPLAELWTFANMIGGYTFAVEAYASYMGKAAYMIRHQLMQFSKQGFVYFDFEEDMVILKPKLFDYIDASLMQRDYDVIRFVSRTTSGKENAILNLTTKDLTINGIPTIFLSDSQNVRLVPSNNSIVMKRNRDFQFDGIIDAGLFKFFGKNFFFEYDNFLVNLQDIDSLAISAFTGEYDSNGKPLTATLDNNIEHITGELLIDVPFNKSGLTTFPEYPIFTSRENSYVYFDEKSIQGGVYEKERFYFELFPFSIDSLDNFRREALKMDGTFISADILPPLELEMSLRPDNSLGFYMTTPEDGLPVFGGKATFYSDIEMSSAGLHGYGSMDYIASTTWSDDFLFHPDSILTTSRKFEELETPGTVSFPLVQNDVTRVRYYPVEDVMTIDRVESVFKMYDDSLAFGGNLELRPSGLTGEGGFSFPDARFESEKFRFQAQRILADSAGAKLRNATAEDFTLMTNDIKLDVDLVRREGSFNSRKDYALVEMPLNLYETRLDQVIWMMDKDEVLMTQSKYLPENQVDIGIDSLKINAPSYVSTHPKQDSLHFVSPLATFNYSSNILDAEKVPFMEIGDSYIFPKEGKVQVLQQATIKPLRDAKILANTESRYHILHGANLVVDSRIHYQGGANYDYVDEFGEIFTFRFDRIGVDTSINSIGTGTIAQTDSFRLSPYFDYQGQVRLNAKDSLLTFAGGVRLTHDCNIGKLWLKFESRIDPDSVLIPVEEKMQNLDLNNIYAGTLKARDSIHIYPTFLSGRKAYFDRNLTFSEGNLVYDKTSRTYEIASEVKLNNMQAEGNYLALNTDTCTLYGEGKINLELDYGRVGIKTVGNAIHDISENSLDLNLLMGLDFFFNPQALNIFGRELDSLPEMDPVNLTTDFYKLGVRNLVGESVADKLETELGLYGKYEVIPDSLKFSLLFNDLPLKWVQETRSYRYNGKIGIGMIGDVQVNKYVDAYVEFVERGSGDIFDIYLMVNKDTWYYLAYSPGGLQVLSSNEKFNTIIYELPEKERKIKSKGKLQSYIFSLASNRRLALFLDRFMTYEDNK